MSVGEQSLDAVRLPVGHDDAHVRVRRGAAVQLRQDTEEVAHEDPRDAAVANDQHGLPGVPRRDAIDRAQRALDDLVERLAAGPGDEAVIAPVRQTAYLIERCTGAVADV